MSNTIKARVDIGKKLDLGFNIRTKVLIRLASGTEFAFHVNPGERLICVPQVHNEFEIFLHEPDEVEISGNVERLFPRPAPVEDDEPAA